jgi:hypothetical protein
LTLLLLLAFWSELGFLGRILIPQADPGELEHVPAFLAQIGSLLLIPISLALALWQPTRTVPDCLPGTYFVPH